MDNFLLGLESLVKLMKIEVLVLFYSPMIRGFVIGYFVASLVYGFIVSGDKRRKGTKK